MSELSMQHQDVTAEIALLIETEDLWGRRIISGIAQAVRGSMPWRLTIAPRDEQWRLRVPDRWKGHGVISPIRDQVTADHVASLGRPVVNISSWGRNLPWASHVITDDRDRARQAFDHFRARGFQRFAYYAPRRLMHLRNRGREFAKLVTDAACSFRDFQEDTEDVQKQPERDVLREWIRGLDTPTAILAGNPQPALQITEICREMEVRIPYEIAVLAADTDDLICEVVEPPISSISLGCERLGVAAVEELARLLQADSRAPATVEIETQGVVERQSTTVLAFGDTLFVQAVEYLRANAVRGINVSDVLSAVPISRRALEQQFVSLLGTSPAAEIRRVRLEAVKQHLRARELSIKEIALITGFASTSQLTRAFSREVGLTPSEFRAQS